MLIDANAYIGHWPFKSLRDNSCQALLGRMNQFGVDISVISHLHAIFYKNTQAANEELYQEIKSHRKYSERFIAFATINPVYGGWKEDLKVCIQKMGMRGVKLFPRYHDYDITEAPVIELVKTARDYGVPVAFPIRMVDYRQRSWMDIPDEWPFKNFLPIVRAVPDARYMFLNLATGIALTQDEKQLLKNADFLFDTSGRSITAPWQLIKDFGKERLAFGTHAPIADYLTGLLRIESMRPDEAGPIEKDLIRSGNIKKFLRL